MGSFCCSGNGDSGQITFDKKPEERIITSVNKESYNNFLSNFNEKNQNINGEYISKENFESIIPNKILNYMKENPLKREKEIVKKSTYDVEPFEFKNGNIYQGKWNKNMEFDGPGKYYLKQDKVFIEGDWEKGNFSYGRIFYPNGDIYEGQIKDSKPNGKGELKTLNNERYEGDFQYGIKKGKGIYTCINEYIYDGYWDNDLPCGFGKLTNWEKNGILKCIWRFGRIAEEPVYEIGNEENFSQVDLNIKLDEMDVNKKELPHLEYVENDSTQYVIKTSLSFLSE